MAVAAALIGSGTFSTSTASKVTTSTGPLFSTSVLVLLVACDNNGTSGVVSLTGAGTDSAGRAWSDVSNLNYTPGSVAADGVTWRAWATMAGSTTAATTTLTFSPNTTRCAYQLWEIRNWPSNSFALYSATKNGASTASPSAFLGNGPVADVVMFGNWAREGLEAVTADSDSANSVTWSAGTDTISSSGTHATSIGLYTQTKVGTIATTPAAETFNPTGTLSDGVAAVFMVLTYGTGATTPVPPGTPSIGTVASTSVDLTWVAGFDYWGADDFVIQYRTVVGPGAWQTFTHAASATAAITVTGLTPGTAYEFQVARHNFTPATSPFSPISASATTLAGFIELNQPRMNQAVARAAVR